MRERLRTFAANKAVRGFAHVLSGSALVTLSQGIQFLLLARVLGPTETGRLAAAAGVTALLLPFSGAGSANVMVMRASRDPAVLPLYLGNSLAVTAGTATLLVLFAAFGAQALLSGQVSFELMLVLALSELFAAKVVDICWQAFVAREQMHLTTTFWLVQSVVRLVAAVLFAAIVSDFTAAHWAWWALASNALVSVGVLGFTIRRIGRPSVDWTILKREFTTGVPFAVGLSAKGFYTDADKIFLARLASPEVAGQYTVAFRLVSVGLMPIRALSLALMAKLFRAGDTGLSGALKLTYRILPPLAGFAVLLAFVFYLGAPLLTLVAGDKYGESVTILRVQCLLPLVLAVQSLLQDALSSSGHARVTAISQVVCAGLICGLCIVLIPHFSWRGAAAASYIAQVVLCLLMYFAIRSRGGSTLAASPEPGA